MFSIPKIVGSVASLILFFSLIERPDIPMKMILKLQTETFKLLDSNWGSPSIFYKNGKFTRVVK